MRTTLTDQRKYIRLEYVIPVEVSIESNGTNAVCQGFSRDIGFGGIGIEFNCSTMPSDISILNLNSKISLEIEHPKQTGFKIQVIGYVKWFNIDDNIQKVYLGVEFAKDTNPRDILSVYNYAKMETRRKSRTRRWFMMSVILMAGMSFWGVNLKMRNSVLIQQISQLDTMKMKMEQNLVQLRDERALLQLELKKLVMEKTTLDKALSQLKYKSSTLNAAISGIENRMVFNQNLPEVNIERIEVIENPAANMSDIARVEGKLNENEKIAGFLKSRYQQLDKSLNNRLKAKRFLDNEIKNLAKDTTTSFAKLVSFGDMRQSGYDELPRTIRALNSELFKFRSETDTMFELCEKKNIGIIFAKVDIADSITPNQFPDLIKRAHLKGIDIHAYFVMDRPTAERNRKACMSWVARIVEYNKSQPEEAQFDGINIEINTESFSEETTRYFEVYLSMLEKLVTGRNSKGSLIEIGVTVPIASSDAKMVMDYKGITADFNKHLIDLADYIVITKINTYGSASPEVERASEFGKKVYIGQDMRINDKTYDPSQSSNYITAIESRMNNIIDTYIDKSGFTGVSINDYSDYYKCVEDNTPEHVKNRRTQIISVCPPKIDYKSPSMSMK